MVEFSMSGMPRPKQRPRATVRAGHAKIYTPSQTKIYERSVRDLAGKAMGDLSPFVGPLSVSLRFRIGIAKSTPKWEREGWLSGELPFMGGPDLDNLLKAIWDGMNATVFVDDKQITRSFATKVPSLNPGVDVRVEALAEPVAP